MSVVMFIISLVLVAGGLVMLITARRTLLRARRSRSWPVVPAVTTHAARHPIGLIHAMSQGTAWEVTVRYHLEHDGRSWEGNQLRFSIWRFGGHSPRNAAALVDQYRAGTPIRVRMNPLNPRDSVIDPRVDQAAIGTLLMLGLLFLSSGVWLMLSVVGWVSL